jgi:hypothetical protein
VLLLNSYYQELVAERIATNEFCPVYDPARVIVPGTEIPQKVVPLEGVEVLVGFGTRISSVVELVEAFRAIPEANATAEVA